jgi:hypothetical protein
MTRVVAGMKWVMLVCGLVTCTMLYAAIAPQAALHSSFGEALEGPVADVVVRSWGVLITLVGAMLVYGAFEVAARPLVLTVAGISKLAFIALVLTGGRQFLAHGAGVAVVSDVIQVTLFAAYLVATRGRVRATA